MSGKGIFSGEASLLIFAALALAVFLPVFAIYVITEDPAGYFAGYQIGKNLVNNPGFERDTNNDGMPNFWMTYNSVALEPAGIIRRWVEEFAHEQNRSMKIVVPREYNAKYGVRGIDIPVIPNTNYVLKAFVKTDGVNGSFMIDILCGADGLQRTFQRNERNIAGTNDWKILYAFLKTKNVASCYVVAAFDKKSSGTAWVDQVKLFQSLACLYNIDCKYFNCSEDPDENIPRCDKTLKQCYCGSECGDGYCDSVESRDGICPKDCADARLSVQTLKDNYKPGQQVYLTDPPEEEDYQTDTGYQTEITDYESQKTLPPQEGSPTSGTRGEGYRGYIIELKEKPVLDADSAADDIDSISSDKIAAQNSMLNNEHGTAKQSIEKALGLKIYAGPGESPSGAGIRLLGETKKVLNSITLDISDGQAEKIRNLPNVKSVKRNFKVESTLMDSVPLINADDVWGLDRNLNNCNDTGQECLTGKGVTIAIIDTGVDYTHPDLGGCLGPGCKVIGGHDFVNLDEDPMDDHGHGTHCAGIAAGNGVLKGVAPDATLYAYKVLDSGGSGYFSDVIAAIEMSVDPNQDGDLSDHADVISMSLGASCGFYTQECGPDDPLSIAVDTAAKSGIVASISAGNSGPSIETIGSPGTARKAITVGATFKKDYNGSYWGNENPKADNITGFSSRGPVKLDNEIINKPDIVAPGAIICSAQWDDAWNTRKCDGLVDEEHIQISGTSMSAPHVAGAVALILQKNPDWTPLEIKTVLKNTAKDLGYDINTQGYGRIDIKRAVEQNRPPIVELETSGTVRGVIDIYGTVKGANFKGYEVYYGESITPSKLICSGTSQVQDGILCLSFDTSVLPYYDYTTLTLVAKSADDTNVTEKKYVYAKNMEIASPQEDDLFTNKETVRITGSAYHRDLKSYEVLVDSIAVAGSGSSPVINDTLGEWDTRTINSPGYHSIRLKVTLRDGTVDYPYVIKVYVDPYLNQAWCRSLGEDVYATPVSGDLNGDGKEEIVVRDYGGRIHIFDSSGNYLPGWPRQIGYRCGWWCSVSPSLADLDNDGLPEIVIHTNNITIYGEEKSFIYAIKPNGTVKETQVGGLRYGFPEYAPVISDIDGDGGKEIIAGYESLGLYVFDNNLNVLSRLYCNGCNVATSTPVLGNFDDDSQLEFAAVFDNKSGKTRLLYIFNKDKTVLPGFPMVINSPSDIYPKSRNHLAAGDIDNDGRMEIVISYPGHVKAYNSDGTLQEGSWPQEIERIDATGDLALADVDSDGKLEILFSQFDGYLNAYNDDGTLLSGWPKRLDYPVVPGPVVIGDIGGGSGSEIISGGSDYDIRRVRSKIYAFESNGSYTTGWPKPVKSVIRQEPLDFHSAPIISDFDRDGKTDMFFAGVDGTMYMWNFDYPYNESSMQWPTFAHDSMHTGCYGCPKARKTVKSMIENTGANQLSGYVLMKVQKKVNGAWSGHAIVVNETVQRAIRPGERVALDKLWADAGGFVPGESGTYRVYVAFIDTNGQVIEAIPGPMAGYYEFEVS